MSVSDAIDEYGASAVSARARHYLARFKALPTRHRVIIVLGAVALVSVFFILVSAVVGRSNAGEKGPAAQLAERIATNPNDVRSRVELGYLYEISGRLDHAMRQYNAALKIDPQNTAALYHRGRIYGESGLDAEAEAAMWDVLEIEPDHAQAAIALGRIYIARKQYRSLGVAVRSVADLNPEVGELQYMAGLAAERTGKAAEAKARYRQALSVDPNLSKARDGLDRLGVVSK